VNRRSSDPPFQTSTPRVLDALASVAISGTSWRQIVSPVVGSNASRSPAASGAYSTPPIIVGVERR
jgi:hypothetical protein